MDFFEENKRNVKTVWKTVKELITIKQKNDLPLTTFQVGKKIETNVKEIANHFNNYFTSIAGELNRKILKPKNMHLLYLESMKENNMLLTPKLPNDIEVLVTWSMLLLQQVYSPVPLNCQILFLFTRKVTSSTAKIIDPYLFFLTLVTFLRKWCIFG